MNKNIKIAIIASQFNKKITDALLKSAMLTFEKHYQLTSNNIDVFLVPGAFEVPNVASKLAFLKKHNKLHDSSPYCCQMHTS